VVLVVDWLLNKKYLFQKMTQNIIQIDSTILAHKIGSGFDLFSRLHHDSYDR